MHTRAIQYCYSVSYAYSSYCAKHKYIVCFLPLSNQDQRVLNQQIDYRCSVTNLLGSRYQDRCCCTVQQSTVVALKQLLVRHKPYYE
jgi:hypothetical protein